VERLLEELTGAGVLDPDQAGWAREYQREHGGSLDTALFELDLIDEQDLLRGLRARHRSRVASPALLERADPAVAERLPAKFSSSFRMCPLAFVDRALLALVQAPLPPEWRRELAELLGVGVDDFVAPAHYLAVARSKVYGVPLDESSAELESRLARRRGAPDPVDVAANMAKRDTLSSAMDELLSFSACLLDFSCFLAPRGGALHVIGRGRTPALPVPEQGCALRPAIVHGGYFLGSLTGSDADLRYYEALGRAIPRRAFVAPVPNAQGGPVVLYADNGARGIATRWVAELTVLVGRLAQGAGEWERAGKNNGGPIAEPARASAPIVEASGEEQAALARLRQRAKESGLTLCALVDQLLASHAPVPVADHATMQLMGEMKGLFERLATDIPSHLARGMELAFRDLAPRMGAGEAASGPAQRTRATASLELVSSDAAPREVASYASLRKKTPRRQL
jgi:MshEN domain